MKNQKLSLETNIFRKFQRFNYQKFISSSLLSLGVILLINLFPSETKAADKISFYYKPYGEFKVQVSDLEILAAEDKITNRLSFFTNQLTPEQLEKLKDLLLRKIELNPIGCDSLQVNNYHENIAITR